jgi:COP9 signalosome complex subunit 4
VSIVQATVYSIFERMYLEHIVTPADAKRFEETSLQLHQKAKLSDGSTIFARALVEHNMLAVSKIYSSITFVSLADILGIDVHKTEKTAAKMVSEGRLSARIDQVDGMLDFVAPSIGMGGNKTFALGSGTAAAVPDTTTEHLAAWDGSIKDLCTTLNSTVEAIRRDFPGLIPENKL